MDQETINLVTTGGATGTLLLFVIGLVRKWWMMTSHHIEVLAQAEKRIAENEANADKRIAAAERRADEWREIARAADRAAQRGAATAHQAAVTAAAVLPAASGD